ncbi:hypothetical protein PAXRUDRAFT_836562 [Paxillus rubicundulus Ve08.2h10]|uniref:Uncharacterized protein n=1 Tax=Paxillus rubicundulus Ve08.2h10 TaxID=930991 RepID=A0A0D0D511_9AGAM|nr:hypothetical protein PAXRUDRAFT_836562 [Paxillus rubicundulus Ve08.2h10]
MPMFLGQRKLTGCTVSSVFPRRSYSSLVFSYASCQQIWTPYPSARAPHDQGSVDTGFRGLMRRLQLYFRSALNLFLTGFILVSKELSTGDQLITAVGSPNGIVAATYCRISNKLSGIQDANPTTATPTRDHPETTNCVSFHEILALAQSSRHASANTEQALAPRYPEVVGSLGDYFQCSCC